MTASLGAAFAAAHSAQRAGFVRDALVASYPRLAGLLAEACARVRAEGSARDAPPAMEPAQEAAVLAAPAAFEAAYLAAAEARLVEAAAAAFPGGPRALPTPADLQKLVARVHEELTAAAAGGERLACLAAGGAAAALRAAAERAELMAAGGPDLRAVGAACTPAQLRNISLANALHEAHRSVAALAGRLPAPAAAALAGALEDVQAAALEAVAPLFRAMVDACQDRILRLHAANLGADEGAEGSVVETSPYLRDLARQLARYRVEYLSKFSPAPGSSGAAPSVARALADRFAARVVVFFVRHAALARPLGRPGCLQLAKDAAELEAAVTQHLAPAEAVEGPLRALRALRRLLFTDTAALAAAPAPPRDLPPPAALHHLFSRAPPALESPHARSKLTPAQYSLWLDEHSQEEALRLIRTSLEACAPRALAAAAAPGERERLEELLALMRRLAGEQAA